MTDFQRRLIERLAIFKQYEKDILVYANTDGGRYLLQQKDRFPIVKVAPNAYFESLPDGKTRGTFWGIDAVSNLFIPTLEKLRIIQETKYAPSLLEQYEAFLHFSGLERKYARFGDILLDTYNPSTSFEDGRVFRTGNDETWAAQQGGNGQGAQQGSADPGNEWCQIQTSTTSDQWAQCIRGIAQFDTSAIPDDSIIDAATLGLYVVSVDQTIAGQSVNIVSAPTGDPATLASADYQTMGSTQVATAITLASMTTGAFNTFTLNSDGRALVSITGVTKLGVRFVSDITNSPPTWASNVGAAFNCRWHTTAGGVSKPVLTVTFSSISSSLSSSLSPSLTPSLSISLSQSLSQSLSISLSPSSSPSFSGSNSLSPSPSTSVSVSISVSPSSSISVSESASISHSATNSPSPSISSSLSPSSTLSASPSSSTSPSASPSAGFAMFTRDDQSSLPSNDNDLTTQYTEQEEEDVSVRDDTRVGQAGTLQYMIHQFKKFVGSQTYALIEAELQSSLDPRYSTVYLQIYNRNSSTWETIDSNSTSDSDVDVELSAVVSDLTNYKDASKIVSCRIYQLAI
jgi:hypothetical protein